MGAQVTFGVDLSMFQGGLAIADLVAQGFEFFAAKCTEGAHTTDPTYPAHYRQAKDAQVLFVAYHFLRSDSSPADQAANLAANIIDKSVKVMVDCEVSGSSRPTLQTANAFKRECAKRGVDVTILYDPHFWWAQTGSPDLTGWHLWQAEYPFTKHEFASVLYRQAGGNSGSGWDTQGGAVPTIWQFASSAKVSGYSGNVDVDAFRGSRAELTASGIFTDFKPAPAPQPDERSGMTRLARFHHEFTKKSIVDLNLLDAAIEHGRDRQVKKVRDAIVKWVSKVPQN